MREDNCAAVQRFLSQRLECEVETRASRKGAETIFAPAREAGGELHLDTELVSASPESDLLERLRQDGVGELLSRGELVKVSRVATEILPRPMR